MKLAIPLSQSRRRINSVVDRYCSWLFDREFSHGLHMKQVAIALAIVVGILFTINRQWLRDATLMNSPAFDALVYQNQSYDDYNLIRREGLAAIIKKYSSQQWHVPPLYMLSGTFSYLLFGRDPANFYIMPAICLYLMLMGVYGFVLYWTRQRGWALLGTALVLTTNSVLAFGLRVSQTDFSVGALYTWALYLLILSEGLRKRRVALLYALSVSVCVLVKSSIVPYFLAHAFIWLIYLPRDSRQRLEWLGNTVIAGVTVLLLAGWFFYFNWTQIITYYTLWGGELSQITRTNNGINSVADDLVFYYHSFRVYHIGPNVELYVQATIFVAACTALALILARGRLADRRVWFGVGVACIWLVVPYSILSMYASKVSSVDFPFLAAFLTIPVLLAASVFRGRAMLIGMLIFLPFLGVQARDQVYVLFQSPPGQDWRERQILSDIFQDADSRSLRQVYVTNAFLHQYLTSENLRFWVVNGTFAEWSDRYKVWPLPVYFDVDAYYNGMMGADYIMTKSGSLVPPQNPNNVLAPAVSQRLAASPDLTVVKRYPLPDGTQLTVYRNNGRSGFDHPPYPSDGWIGPRFPITFYGKPKDWQIQIEGRILIPPTTSYPVQVYLETEQGEIVTNRELVTTSDPVAVLLNIPVSSLAPDGQKTTLYLMTDHIFRPSDYRISTDTRELMMIVTSLAEKKR